MSRISAILAVVLLLAGTASCSERESSPNRGTRPSSDTPQAEAGQHGAAADESLPLLAIMLQMAADMSGLMQALWLQDYEQMSAHAAAVAGHAGISAGEVARIESQLGAEMAAFVAADEAVHQASVRLQTAAEARDMDAFLEQLAVVQRGCVDCHRRFREQLSTRRSASR